MKLKAAFPQKRNKRMFSVMKIAAVLMVALGVGFYFLAPQFPGSDTPMVEVQDEEMEKTPVKAEEFQLSKVSPEFRKIENYYLASLNLELAKLEITKKNKELIDSFMEQMAMLEKEYQRLNKEFSETGANEQTIEAMIKNLQLRLELLFKLKNKINEIKQSEKNKYENAQA